jgi:hypothetical protein
MDRLAGLARRIENWGVISGKRLAGKVVDTPGHADGASIVTSRVIEVRLMGQGWADHYPVAFTASGSAYRLGAPSASFGRRKADEFIYRKWKAPPPDSGFAPVPVDSEGTVIGGLLDFSAFGIEHIDVYESSFQRR